MQLDIFSEVTEIGVDAWEHLSKLDFTKSEQFAKEANSKYPEDENTALCLKRIQDWMFVLNAHVTVSAILQQIKTYPFTTSWGDEKLKMSLLNMVIRLTIDSDKFKIDEDHDLSEVYVLTGDLAAAVSALENYITETTPTAKTQLRLANLLWSAGKISKANQQYMLTFFSFADEVSVERIEHPVLQKLAKLYSIPMSIPWSSLYGEQMPLSTAARFTEHADTEVKNAANACVAMAEDHAARMARKLSIEARRKLAECDKKLFESYMHGLQTGHPLIF